MKSAPETLPDIASLPELKVGPVVLQGQHVRLEPLTLEHLPELAEVAFEASIWRWTTLRIVTAADLDKFFSVAIAESEAGVSMPWVTRSLADGKLAGSTRFMDIVRPHRTLELGGTWLHSRYQRSGINVEAKYLQLRHAFETMGARRVALKTHHKNLKSQTAMQALGATREGVFRNHILHWDGSTRHSVWFSVIAEEWQEVKTRLEGRLRAFGEWSPAR